MTKDELITLFTSIGIPRRFWETVPTDYFGDKEAIKAVTRYVDANKKVFIRGLGLMLTGGRDSGKTFLASILLKELFMKGYSCTYTTLSELTTAMIQPVPGQFFHKDIVAPDFLVIDGIDEFNEGSKTALRRVITRRRDEAKPLILCTVFPYEENAGVLPASLGTDFERFMSTARVVECSVNPFLVSKHYRKLNKYGV